MPNPPTELAVPAELGVEHIAAQVLPRAPGGKPRGMSYVDSLTPELFVPTAARPVRAKLRWLAADTQVMPHSHPWAQVAISTTGVIRLTVNHGTYIVPPSRALWIPPGVEHAVTMVEDADLRTLYFHQPRGRCGPGVPRDQEDAWRQCRVLEVSDLLRALVREMPTAPDGGLAISPNDLRREQHLSALVRDELARAAAVKLGVDLPQDKRLRHLCEAVLADPTHHDTLADWAQDTGASPRTVARLFRSELGSTFTQWRQQVILAKAVSLAAGRMPVGQIAAELGYSPSAFSAMVRKSVGQPPGRFLGQQQPVPQ
ncbi:AraC-like DNA-binding protein [Acidovorax delafieldii]|uniref:AraC-like DNA-binding protein n=1 Tax=Acidovorax delafieldii TaxID=47920 RepID=A0AAJ2BS43_ACIDE|nr:helix-turn-helix transcriptional regulator [Acidovorax delafieldii]MDR6765163.1 AraC-like DNA-binding protein [Acidovorax delafieldii]MDR6835601.1 AraC-like DNA-binding protein [Acidovorax delafieldii]MDR7365429.1 AraC-like DNA-binding protein [Acidovorax delafieldii]